MFDIFSIWILFNKIQGFGRMISPLTIRRDLCFDIFNKRCVVMTTISVKFLIQCAVCRHTNISEKAFCYQLNQRQNWKISDFWTTKRISTQEDVSDASITSRKGPIGQDFGLFVAITGWQRDSSTTSWWQPTEWHHFKCWCIHEHWSGWRHTHQLYQSLLWVLVYKRTTNTLCSHPWWRECDGQHRIAAQIHSKWEQKSKSWVTNTLTSSSHQHNILSCFICFTS